MDSLKSVAIIILLTCAALRNCRAQIQPQFQQQFESPDAFFVRDPAFTSCPMWCRCVTSPVNDAITPPGTFGSSSSGGRQQQQQQLYKNVTCAIQPGFIDRLDRWLQSNPIDRDVDILFFSYTPLSAERAELNEQVVTAQLPPVFAQFARLKILGLSNIGLESIPPVTADQLAGVLALYLDNNNISRVGDLSLERMRQLELVDLSQNPVSPVGVRSDDLPPKLHSVGFGYNALNRIPIELVRAVPGLRWLDLTGNQISTLEQPALDELGSAARLEYVRLQDNPLRCDGIAASTLSSALRAPLARTPAAVAQQQSGRDGVQQKTLRDMLCGYDGQCPRCLTPVALRGTPIDELQP